MLALSYRFLFLVEALGPIMQATNLLVVVIYNSNQWSLLIASAGDRNNEVTISSVLYMCYAVFLSADYFVHLLIRVPFTLSILGVVVYYR